MRYPSDQLFITISPSLPTPLSLCQVTQGSKFDNFPFCLQKESNFLHIYKIVILRSLIRRVDNGNSFFNGLKVSFFYRCIAYFVSNFNVHSSDVHFELYNKCILTFHVFLGWPKTLSSCCPRFRIYSPWRRETPLLWFMLFWLNCIL